MTADCFFGKHHGVSDDDALDGLDFRDLDGETCSVSLSSTLYSSQERRACHASQSVWSHNQQDPIRICISPAPPGSG